MAIRFLQVMWVLSLAYNQTFRKLASLLQELHRPVLVYKFSANVYKLR